MSSLSHGNRKLNLTLGLCRIVGFERDDFRMPAWTVDVGQELNDEIDLFSGLKLWRRHGRLGAASTRLDLPDLKRR